MLALCVLLTDGAVRGNIEALCESAISNYLDAESSVLAARSTMLIYELMKQKNQYKEASLLITGMAAEVFIWRIFCDI